MGDTVSDTGVDLRDLKDLKQGLKLQAQLLESHVRSGTYYQMGVTQHVRHLTVLNSALIVVIEQLLTERPTTERRSENTERETDHD